MNKLISLSLDKIISPNNHFYPHLSGKNLTYAKLFNIYACVGLLHYWLIHDCEETIENMTQYLYQNTAKVLMISSD